MVVATHYRNDRGPHSPSSPRVYLTFIFDAHISRSKITVEARKIGSLWRDAPGRLGEKSLAIKRLDGRGTASRSNSEDEVKEV
jgi:hypothetical protein